MQATLSPSLFSPTSLQQFVDDELLRAPLIAEQVIDGALEHARKALSAMLPKERASTQELVQNLLMRRREVAGAFTATLQETADSALDAARQSRGGRFASQAPMALADVRPDQLCLVDEDAVAVDVELSHVVSAIRDGAEHELRELRCYLAAMAGDQAVSTDHNPFKPEGYARALWAGAQELPLSRNAQMAFLRHAGQALAAVLRKSYAAACSRLESMGVEPASYRTILFGSGAPVRPEPMLAIISAPDLQLMRAAMPGAYPSAARGGPQGSAQAHGTQAPVHGIAGPAGPDHALAHASTQGRHGHQGLVGAMGSRDPAEGSSSQGPVLDFSAGVAPHVPTRAWPTASGVHTLTRATGAAPQPVQHRLGLFKGQLASGKGARGAAPQLEENKATSRGPRGGPKNSRSLAAASPQELASSTTRTKDRQVALPHWSEFTAPSSDHSTRQAVELVGRLFEAMLGNTALPADVVALISRLHGPAMRLVVGDSALLDHDTHPLWRFIHRLVYEAQMRPLSDDPERLAWLQACQRLIEGLATDPRQEVATYEVAVTRLEQFRQQRLALRCTAAAAQIAELERLEIRLCTGHAPSSTQNVMVDLGLLDTVPAHILARMQDQVPPADEAQDWLRRLEPGVWVRLFIDGRWVHAQVLWPGVRGELWLIADGASNDTWAVRRNAFLRMRASALAKTLQIRSLVNSAAVQVQEMLATPAAAAPG